MLVDYVYSPGLKSLFKNRINFPASFFHIEIAFSENIIKQVCWMCFCVNDRRPLLKVFKTKLRSRLLRPSTKAKFYVKFKRSFSFLKTRKCILIILFGLELISCREIKRSLHKIQHFRTNCSFITNKMIILTFLERLIKNYFLKFF